MDISPKKRKESNPINTETQKHKRRQQERKRGTKDQKKKKNGRKKNSLIRQNAK